MNKNIWILGILALAACNRAPVDAPVYDDGYMVSDYVFVDDASADACADAAGQQQIAYSMPNGNDLKLETAKTVLHVGATPGRQYAYYVWAGDGDTTRDPDLIVDDGVAAVLISE